MCVNLNIRSDIWWSYPFKITRSSLTLSDLSPLIILFPLLRYVLPPIHLVCVRLYILLSIPISLEGKLCVITWIILRWSSERTVVFFNHSPSLSRISPFLRYQSTVKVPVIAPLWLPDTSLSTDRLHQVRWSLFLSFFLHTSRFHNWIPNRSWQVRSRTRLMSPEMTLSPLWNRFHRQPPVPQYIYVR